MANKESLFSRIEANPGAATGDIYYTASSGGVPTILPIGSTNKALVVASGLPSWGNIDNSVTTADSANTASAIVARDGSGNFSAGTITASLSGTATNASNSGITDDTSTNATMYPVWVTANTGNLPDKVSSTKMTFNPSTGALTASRLISNVATGTAPLAITSTTAVTNLTLSADSQLPTISTALKVSNSATTATSANTASAIVARDASHNFSAGTITASLTGDISGNSATCTLATASTAAAVTDNTSTNASYYPVWSPTSSSNNALGVSSTKITFNPSTGTLSTTGIATKKSLVTLANGLNSNIAVTSSFVKTSGPTTGYSVGGFTPGVDGQLMTVEFVGAAAAPCTIVNADASSTAAWQILTQTAANVVLTTPSANQLSWAQFIYEATGARWILLGHS